MCQKIRGFEIVSKDRHYPLEDIKIPSRSTKHSAGYDYILPIDLVIKPKSVCKIYTDIKAYMQNDEFMTLCLRSSMAIKKSLQLYNSSLFIIDKDYYNNPDNEGNIILALYNPTDKEIELKKGEGVVQFIFQKYLIVDNENTDSLAQRVGGIGSTYESENDTKQR